MTPLACKTVDYHEAELAFKVKVQIATALIEWQRGREKKQSRRELSD